MLLVVVIAGLFVLVALIIACAVIAAKKDPKEGKSKADRSSDPDVEACNVNDAICAQTEREKSALVLETKEPFFEDFDVKDSSSDPVVEACNVNDAICAQTEREKSALVLETKEPFYEDLNVKDSSSDPVVEACNVNDAICAQTEREKSALVLETKEPFFEDFDVKDSSSDPVVEACNVNDAICTFASVLNGQDVMGGQLLIECKASINNAIATGLSEDERMQLAVHEAGHAWLAFRGGFRVVKITLIPNGELLGRTILEHGAKNVWSFKERNNLQIAFWAARCAELSLRGNEMTTLFGADKLAIRKLAESNVHEYGLCEDQALATIKPNSNEFMSKQDAVIYGNMKFCETQAIKMVEEDKQAINALAQLLYNCNELTDEGRIRKIFLQLQADHQKKE
uniref:Peptidase M41 domain-containing protein n=1 Tax=Meloidogyne incognita TaxID=6306 RepID=A0A914LR11_MELIC